MIHQACKCPLFLFLLSALLLSAARGADEVRLTKDIEYARVGDIALKLDLYVPPAATPPPVIVWVHGGAWRSGSKDNPPLLPVTAHSYAIASVDYRLSPLVKFPAQIHDIKAAIRYLRAKAGQHGIDAKKIAIAGSSAGGHLAALVGVSNGVKQLEGEVGQHRDQSSDVQAIVDFYGASNLTTILAQSTPHGLSVRVPALELLLGGQPDAKVELARLASPVDHLDPSDPPLLIYHGDQDPQMPFAQAQELVAAYKKHGLPVTFEVVSGGVHGGKLFYTTDQIQQVADFLSTILNNSRK